MKNKFTTKQILFVVLAILLIPNGVVGKSRFGTIVKYKGDIRVQRSGETEKEKVVTTGYEVNANDMLLVGPKSRVFLQMEDKSRIVLFQKTVIRPENVNTLKLIQGKTALNIKKRKSKKKKRFSVRTTSAIVGVRGTRFLVKAEAEDLSLIHI